MNFLCSKPNRRWSLSPVRFSWMTLLIVVALSLLTLRVAATMHRNLAGAQPDLGYVSEQWLTEYRADASRPPR